MNTNRNIIYTTGTGTISYPSSNTRNPSIIPPTFTSKNYKIFKEKLTQILKKQV